MKKLVRWKQTGNLVRDGVARQRHKGDEDVMNPHEARSYELCGLVEIVGDASEVSKVVAAAPEPEEETDVFDGSEIAFPPEDEEEREDDECLS